MKIPMKRIMDGYRALSCMELIQPLPYLKMRELYEVRKALQSEVATAGEVEMETIGRLGGTISDTGQITFPDAEKLSIYKRSMNEMHASEVELSIERIDLSDYAGGIVFKSMDVDLDALGEFIKLEEG